MVNLLELQQPHIVTKIAKNIICEIKNYPESLVDEFAEDKQFIDLMWCLV